MIKASTFASYNFDKDTGWRDDLPMHIVPGTRVLCLYRVSTTKQLYHDEHNEADIPMQRLRCREFAESQGWTIVCELQEEGISGHKVRAENRDKIQMIKGYAQQGKFDIFLVFMFDRIGRISDETPFVVEWLVSHHIRVWSATEGEQRMESHTDKLLNYIRFWQADGESQKTSIRTANSLRILNEQGCFTGRVCPYGYQLVKSGRTNKKKHEVHDLAIQEDEAAVIRIIFQMAYTHGYGAQCIANHLTSMGYKNRSGKNWHPATLQSILRNPVYIGVLRCGESKSIQENLKIIDDKTFEEVQKMLQMRSRKNQSVRSAPLNTRGNSLLAGNIFCGHCGARLCITTCGKGRPRADGTGAVKTRYCCQTKTRTHGECDGQTGYTLHKVDSIIDTVIHNIFSRVKSIDRNDLIQARNENDLKAKRAHVHELQALLQKADEDIMRLQDEISAALAGESAFTPDMLRKAIERQETKRDGLIAGLQEAEQSLHTTENSSQIFAEQFDDILKWERIYDSADMAAKKMIVSRLIDRVDMYRGYDIKITLNISVEQFLNSIEECA